VAKILKNTTLSDIELDFLGVTVPASGQLTIDPEDYLDLGTDDSTNEIDPFITSGDIVVNDGTNDLGITAGQNFIRFPDNAPNIRYDNTISGLISTDVKNAIDELAGTVTVDEFAFFPIWAEENAALGNNLREWSFGNGAQGDIGIVLPVDAQLYAVSYNADNAGTNTEIAVVQNTSSQVATTGPQSGEDGFNILGTPVQFSAGDRLGFQTILAGGASDVRVCAWMRVPSSIAVDLSLGELNDVTLTGETNGQFIAYNGSEWINVDPEATRITYDNTLSGLTATNVQGALDEIDGNVDTNTTNIATNTGNISTNATNIGNNTTLITDHINDPTDAHDASAISYDNATSGLTATDVQAAIDELEDEIDNITAPVDSVFGRTGAVVAVAGDYDADQIDYDNTTSGLTATDVQAAIDELEDEIDNIPAAPVTSVNGQVGVVVLDADDIDDSLTTNKFATQAQLDQITTNQTDIATNASNISTNTTNIATNTGNITTNTTNIATNTSDIATNASNLTNHINDPVDAHDASAISYNNSTSGLTATDVQAAIDELEDEIDNIPAAPVTSVNGQTGVVVLDADDIDDSLTTNKFATQAELDQIATNQTNIATNAGNISTNTTNIATNASDITTLENRNINTTVPLQGGGDLTADRTISLDIDSATAATPAGADQILIADASDSNNTKKTTLSSLVALVPPAPVTSVNGQTGVVVLDADDIDDSVTTNKFATQAELDQIATNQSNISTNTSNIATNTANIATNATNISNNTTLITDHINDPTDAHDASAISYDNAASGLTATDAQAAIDEVDSDLDTHIADLNNPHQTTFTQAVAADPGTDITAAEAEELTDGSTTQLHFHRELVDETGTDRVDVLNGGDVQLSNYPQTRNDTTSNDEKVLTTDGSGNLVLRRVLPFYDSIKKVSNAVDQVGINQTTVLEDWLELSTTIPETGNYDIDWTYVWSFNDTGQDFEAQILLDGSPISTYSAHIQEPKDSAGGGIDLLNTTGGVSNTSTNQRHRTAGFEPEVNLTAGVHTVTIQWAGSQNNDEATIYEGAIRIKRVS